MTATPISGGSSISNSGHLRKLLQRAMRFSLKLFYFVVLFVTIWQPKPVFAYWLDMPPPKSEQDAMAMCQTIASMIMAGNKDAAYYVLGGEWGAFEEFGGPDDVNIIFYSLDCGR